MTELLAVDERPHRTVVDLEATLAQFGDQSAQGEVRLPAAVHQPVVVSPRNLPWLVAADLARCDATRLAKALKPQNGGAYTDAKSRRGLMTGQATLRDRRNYPFP